MNQEIIRELRDKALDGDKDALETYNEYVNKGLATRLVVKETFLDSQMSQQLMSQGYREEAIKRGDKLETSMYSGLDKPLHEVVRNPYTLMSHGYDERANKPPGKTKTFNKSESFAEIERRYKEATHSKKFDELFN